MSKKKFFGGIGNPPYQDDTIGENMSYAPPLYNTMIDAASNISDRVEMITPARFLFNAGSTPKAWNEKMLNDPHFKVMSYEPDSSKVFPGTNIKGGVAVTYRDKTKTYEPIKTFIPNETHKKIAVKISQRHEKSLSKIMYASERYKFTDAMHNEHPEVESLLSKGHRYDMKSSVLSKLDDIVFFENKPDDGNEYVRIFGVIKNKRVTRWIKRSYINAPENFDKWKVFLPQANGSGALGEVLSTPLIGAPLIGATQTFMSIGCFDTENEAQACMKYIKTKFARTLLGVLKVTQSNSIATWLYVPIQDFTSNSDIDWSQSVADIDRQLYKKYELTEDEIAFIEEKVKAME